jgi:hypothetical protein
MKLINQRLKDIYETTLNDDIKYEGIVDENLDYYSLFCKAAAKEKLFKIEKNNVCMFNCVYEDKEAVMIIFALPINTENNSGVKNIAERVINIVKVLEECFIKFEYMNSISVNEDKFIYVTSIKMNEVLKGD